MTSETKDNIYYISDALDLIITGTVLIGQTSAVNLMPFFFSYIAKKFLGITRDLDIGNWGSRSFSNF